MPITPEEFLDYAGPLTVDKTQTHTGRKWSSTTRIGVVGKVNASIIVPAFSINKLNTETGPSFYPLFTKGRGGIFPYCFIQYNYSVGQKFSLIDYDSVLNQQAFNNNVWTFCFPVLRWRVGTTPTRYIINTKAYQDIIQGEFMYPLYAPYYTGQIIPSEFCLEVYALNPFPGLTYAMGLSENFPLQTSIMYNPLLVGTQNIEPMESVTNDLYFSLPQNLPITQPADVAWNSN